MNLEIREKGENERGGEKLKIKKVVGIKERYFFIFISKRRKNGIKMLLRSKSHYST